MNKPVQDIDTKTAAERWGVKLGTVAKYCKDGLIPGAIKVNNAWKIPSDSIKPLIQDDIVKILRLVNSLKHYPDLAVDYEASGLSDKNVLRIFQYLVAIGMMQSFDISMPVEQLPYELSLSQRGIDLITTSGKKKSNIDVTAKDIVKIGANVLVKVIIEIAKVA